LSNQSRKAKDADGRTVTVRVSVPIDRHTHAKLVARAALAGKDRAVVAAELLKKGLRGVIVQDPEKADSAGENDGSTE
jgi:hypothetical protein